MIMGRGDKRVQVVAELRDEYEKLNRVLQKQVELQKDIKSSLDAQNRKAGANARAVAGGFGPSGFLDEPGSNASAQASANGGGTGGSASGMNWGGAAKAIAAAAGAAALQALPRNEQFIENSMALSRGGFFGARNLSPTLQRTMYGGTAIDPMDAARMSMAGNSMGMMTGLANYSTITGSAATFSNLVAGAGLEGGMRATTALNQAGSVNRLRMLGINVRDANTGLMRGFEDIANDLWKILNNQKSGAGQITKQDLSLALQPGNSLDGLLNQYFGNDPVLRQGVVTALFQKAGGAGLSQQELKASGALPEVAYEFGQRDAASYRAIDAYTKPAIEGINEANRLLKTASEKFADAADELSGIVKQIAKINTLMGGGNGGMGTLFGGILGGLGALGIGGAVKGIGSKIAGSSAFQGLKGMWNKLPKWARFGGRVAGAAGTYAGLEWLQKWLNEKGEDLPDWVRSAGNVAFDTGQGALTGLVGGGVPGLFAGTAGGLAGSLINPVELKNNGDGGDVYDIPGITRIAHYHSGRGGSSSSLTSAAGTSMREVVDPLGTMSITSPFGVVRHLSTPDGRKSPTYGRAHGGVDLAASVGTPAYAVKDGVVEGTPYDADGFGNYIKINHPDGYSTFYGHLSSKSVSGGTSVSAGQQIGATGNSGFSTGPHLHFEVRTKGGSKVNPLDYIAASGGMSGEDLPPSTLQPQNALNEQVKAAGALSGVSLLDFGFGASLFSNATGDGDPKSSGTVARGPKLRIKLNMPPVPNDGDGGAGTVGTKIVNYGGVNVTVNVPKDSKLDEQKLAMKIKTLLSDDDRIKAAVRK